MKKLYKRLGICVLLAALVWCGTLISDRQRLHDGLIRLHVVANSDSQEDQALKLRVRDALTEALSDVMANITNPEQAKAYIRENLLRLQEIAEDVLAAAGCDLAVTVNLAEEAFETRYYDTFTLPAGVYESLRITIGEGAGENWWCVVFPTLCIPATSDGFEAEAVGAGFPESLTGALEGENAYEVRFFLLDLMGKLENIFYAG